MKLGRGQSGQSRPMGQVVYVAAVGENLEELKMTTIFRGGESLDLWSAQKRSEYISIWRRSCAGDQFGSCTGRRSGFRKGNEWL